MKKLISHMFLLAAIPIISHALPDRFVYLHDVDPSIIQEMRYATTHNFIGRPVKGYDAGVCILTAAAASKLAEAQKELHKHSLSLKVYDCYRPTSAVADFAAWSSDPARQEMKTEFYPYTNKADLFRLGYLAAKSGHSRGSTVDLTIVPLPVPPQAGYHPGQQLVSCAAPRRLRFRDNSIEMGTGFDCLDELAASFNQHVGKTSYERRMMLRQLMMKYGFEPYDKEWWHFTLRREAYHDTYFNFAVR